MADAAMQTATVSVEDDADDGSNDTADDGPADVTITVNRRTLGK